MSLRNIFIDIVKLMVQDKDEIAISYSSGIDSHCLLFALKELGKKVKGYTFHIDGVESQDYIYSKKNAKIFGIELVECIIPNKLDKELLVRMIERYQLKKKVDVECMYPFYFLLPKVVEKTLLSGHCSDAHFCVSKRGKHDPL